jgi:alanine racemase
MDEPLARFREATQGLNLPVSVCNSAATLTPDALHGAWVRPGIMLYGASPYADRSAASLGLVPAMTLRSRLIATQSLEPGESVGYGSTFVASLGLKPAMRLTARIIAVQSLEPGDGVGYGLSFRAPARMRIGIVACGYADGYPRIVPTGTPVAVEGIASRTVGRVSMDMLAVDLTNIPNAQVGSEVELWGDAVPIDEVARAAGTVGYELMCAVTARVPMEVID